MAYIYHGITGWTRVGQAVLTENKSGLRVAQLTYQCAAITTTPPFTEGQELDSPFVNYYVYPTPKISIGQDGLSTAIVDAYSYNQNMKQDELRVNFVETTGRFYPYNPPVTDGIPFTAILTTRGAYVKDAQPTYAITTPTTSVTGGAILIRTYFQSGNPVPSYNVDMNVSQVFTQISQSQTSFGQISEIECVYDTKITAIYATQYAP